MSLHSANLPSIAIASGTTVTTTPITAHLSDAQTITIQAPAVLSGTITVGVSHGTTTYATLQSGGADVTMTQGEALTIDPWGGYQSLQLTSGTTETTARTFTVTKTFMVGR